MLQTCGLGRASSDTSKNFRFEVQTCSWKTVIGASCPPAPQSYRCLVILTEPRGSANQIMKKSSAVKGMKRLRNSSGKLVLEEKEMAEIAREHFKRNAQSTTGFHSEENGQPEFERQRVKLEVEEIENWKSHSLL